LAEFKGGLFEYSPSLVVFTSNFTIRELFEHRVPDITLRATLRRFIEVRISTRDD